jgi:hypothetical protein
MSIFIYMSEFLKFQTHNGYVRGIPFFVPDAAIGQEELLERISHWHRFNDLHIANDCRPRNVQTWETDNSNSLDVSVARGVWDGASGSVEQAVAY